MLNERIGIGNRGKDSEYVNKLRERRTRCVGMAAFDWLQHVNMLT